MADPDQLTLLKRSVEEWNAWRETHPDVKVDLSGADLSGADLSGADLHGADVTGAKFTQGDSVYGIEGWNLYWKISDPGRGIDLRFANLRGADLRETTFGPTYVDFWSQVRDESKSIITGPGLWRRNTMAEPHPSPSSPTIGWLGLVETVGANLFVTAATLASIIQGLDVVERRWREHLKKHKQQGSQTPQPASASSTQPAAAPSHKTSASDKEITEILLVMDDGSRHGFKRWISDPDALKAYIDAFSDPTSKVKPLQVVFKKREGRALVVDVTTGGKDNKQLNVILGYLEADPV